jgi:hypothetical protein
MVKVCLDLRKKPQIELNLTKLHQNLIGFNHLYPNLKHVYQDYIPIRKENTNILKNYPIMYHFQKEPLFIAIAV